MAKNIQCFGMQTTADLFFTHGKKQFLAGEVKRTMMIASVRIHIEKVIDLLKNCLTILKDILPLQTVKGLAVYANCKPFFSCDRTVTVCATLVNLEESIVYKNR